jgi:hypothetical protein
MTIIRTLFASISASAMLAMGGCATSTMDRSSPELAMSGSDEQICHEMAVARAPNDPVNELSMPGNMVNAAGSANLGAPLLASKFPMIFPAKNATTVAELTAECMQARGHYIARR